MYSGNIVISTVSILVFSFDIGINWFLVGWGVVSWSSMVDWGVVSWSGMVDWGVVSRCSMVGWGNLVNRGGVIGWGMSYGMAVSSRMSMFN